MNHKLIGLTITTLCALAAIPTGELVLIPAGLILGSLYYFGKVAK